MALVKLSDGKTRQLTHEKGIEYWQILNKQIEPDEKQAKACQYIVAIYLDWHTAPLDYLEERLSVLRAMYRGSADAAELEKRIRELRAANGEN